MIKKRKTKIQTGVGLTALIIGTTANATTIFADNFDRPDDVDLNASTVGQSGALGTLNWVEVDGGAGAAGGTAIVGNRLSIGEDGGGGGGWAIAYPDHNFTDALITTGGEFTVSIDLGIPLASNGGTRFTGFAVGHSKGEMDGWSANSPTSFDSDFFFGYDTTGTDELKIITNGTEDYDQNINLDATGGTLSVTFSGITDFNLGSIVNYEAFLNGSSIDSGIFTWSGTNENYLGLYSNYTGNQGLIDNFEVSAVPEPSSLSLIGLATLGLIRRRRSA